MAAVSAPGDPVFGADAGDLRLLRMGGSAALLLVAGYLATFPLYALAGGPPPSGAEAHLAHYAGHLAGWWGILCLMVFTDVLYLVAWIALYQALKHVDRNLALLSLVCAALFVGLDLAVTWTGHAALFLLSDAYRTAAAVDRAAIVAAAGFPVALMETPLLAVYAILIPSVGPFLASLAMRRSAFGLSTIVLGHLIGVSGIVAVAGPHLSSALDLAHVVNALLVTVWFALVGARLVRLSMS